MTADRKRQGERTNDDAADSGKLSNPDIFEVLFLGALGTLHDHKRSSRKDELPEPALKFIRAHGLGSLQNELLALHVAYKRCVPYEPRPKGAPRNPTQTYVSTLRKLQSLIRQIDRARGEDFFLEQDGSLAAPFKGTTFVIRDGPRKRLQKLVDECIHSEDRIADAPASKGGRPQMYLNGACKVLALVLCRNGDFLLKPGDHITLAEMLFAADIEGAGRKGEAPRLRDVVERSRRAVLASRKTRKK